MRLRKKQQLVSCLCCFGLTLKYRNGKPIVSKQGVYTYVGDIEDIEDVYHYVAYLNRAIENYMNGIIK